MLPKKNPKEIREKLLKWSEANDPKYPWRKTKNLFEILITEILLQKTIASNVSNLYRQFFQKYDSFEKIFNSDIDELQQDIKSLGLSNKRAKILKNLSNLVVKDCKGTIPESPETLKKINGIADYVSNAYLCFGLNKRTFFYDVNIKRIVSRVFKGTDAKVKVEFIQEKLDQLLPKGECKFFYWAILDLGNQICRKTNPKCETCPISSYCSFK
ncbi:MAG: endonuclease III domain-containing protein [Candidatus Hermodarchaeota archaeon]